MTKPNYYKRIDANQTDKDQAALIYAERKITAREWMDKTADTLWLYATMLCNEYGMEHPTKQVLKQIVSLAHADCFGYVRE